MNRILTVLLACILLFAVSACSIEKPAAPGSTAPSVNSEQSGQEKKAESSKFTEKEALQLVKEQVLKDYNNEDTKVDEDSGQILDQNDAAYLIGFDISDNVYGNHLYTEAYWISKKTRQIKDVCSINEYYEGLIDITKGESNF